MNRNTVFAIVALGGAFLIGLGSAALRQRLVAEPQTATLFTTPRTLGQIGLLDQNAETVSVERLQGRWDVLFFGFTHCPDICPTTLSYLHRVAERLGDLPLKRQPRYWLVSVDPARDHPAILKPYLAHFDPAFQGMTGTEQQIGTLARALGVAYQRVDLGEDYTMEHSAALFLIDPQGRYAGLFSSPHEWDAIASDLRILSR